MTCIYLIRHCEAEGNKKRLFQGSTDCDISETGAIQLEYLNKRFKNIHLDAVYSSPLRRAMKTAHAVADDKGLKVIPRVDLTELHGGIVEGRPFAEAFNEIEGLADTWNNHPQDFHPQDGESMRNAYERIWLEIRALAEENKGKSIAVATHGGVTRCLLCRLLYNNINRLKDVPWCENTAVTLLHVDDNLNFTVKSINDHTHVPPQFMPKRSRIIEKAEVKSK